MKLFKRPYITYFIFGIIGILTVILEFMLKDYKTIPILILFFILFTYVLEKSLPKTGETKIVINTYRKEDNIMKNKQIPAVTVMNAAYSAFSQVGDKSYAEKKTNNFLKRCGADINKPKEQSLDLGIVKDVAFAMLDRDNEKLFWTNLKKLQ